MNALREDGSEHRREVFKTCKTAGVPVPRLSPRHLSSTWRIKKARLITNSMILRSRVRRKHSDFHKTVDYSRVCRL